ncbi:MAG: hypothetical protein QXJ64_03500 [Thermosphaera sp.]
MRIPHFFTIFSKKRDDSLLENLKKLPEEILSLHSIFYHTQKNPYGLNKNYMNIMLGKRSGLFSKGSKQKFMIVMKHPKYIYKYILSNYCPDVITIRVDYESHIDYLMSISYVMEFMKFLKKPLLFYCDADRNYINNVFRSELIRKGHVINIDNIRETVPDRNFYESVYGIVLSKVNSLDNGERRIIIRDGREEEGVPLDSYGNYLPFYNYYVDFLVTDTRVRVVGVVNFLKSVYTV